MPALGNALGNVFRYVETKATIVIQRHEELIRNLDMQQHTRSAVNRINAELQTLLRCKRIAHAGEVRRPAFVVARIPHQILSDQIGL